MESKRGFPFAEQRYEDEDDLGCGEVPGGEVFQREGGLNPIHQIRLERCREENLGVR